MPLAVAPPHGPFERDASAGSQESQGGTRASAGVHLLDLSDPCRPRPQVVEVLAHRLFGENGQLGEIRGALDVCRREASFSHDPAVVGGVVIRVFHEAGHLRVGVCLDSIPLPSGGVTQERQLLVKVCSEPRPATLDPGSHDRKILGEDGEAVVQRRRSRGWIQVGSSRW